MLNSKFYIELKERKVYLQEQIKLMNGFINAYQNIRIKVGVERDVMRFYIRESEFQNYKYSNDYERIGFILNSYYARRCLPAIKYELNHITKILNNPAGKKAKELFDSLPQQKRKHMGINIFDQYDIACAKKWASTPYQSLGFLPSDPEHYSLSGKRVRSKSEGRIIDGLEARNVYYQYEYPVKVGRYIQYPDFRIFRLRDHKIIYWEH